MKNINKGRIKDFLRRGFKKKVFRHFLENDYQKNCLGAHKLSHASQCLTTKLLVFFA